MNRHSNFMDIHHRQDKKFCRFMVERLDKFKYDKDVENTLRLSISNENDTLALGNEIGNIISSMYHLNVPVTGIYLYGKFRIGKSTLIKGIVNSLEHIENNEKVDVKRMTRFQKYEMVYPNVYHIDYFKDRFTGFQVTPIELKDNEMLIAEWPETLNENSLEKNRIEIELLELGPNENITEKSDVMIYQKLQHRQALYASMIGYDNGVQLIWKLKENYNV